MLLFFATVEDQFVVYGSVNRKIDCEGEKYIKSGPLSISLIVEQINIAYTWYLVPQVWQEAV